MAARAWGHKSYEFDLATTQATRHDSTGTHSQTVTAYEILVADPAIVRRAFPSEAARTDFIEKSFRDLELRQLATPEHRERPHPLSDVVGESLSSVTFVVDYVQLSFGGGPPLNLYVWPRIHSQFAVLRRPDRG